MSPARSRTGIAAALVALAAVLALPGAAHSELPSKATVTDKVGDAPKAIDLTTSTYSLTRERATFRTTVKDLTSRTFVAFEIWPLASAWDRIAIRRVDGRTVARVYFIDNDLQDSDKPVAYGTRCPGLEVAWRPRLDRVAATVPAACLRASRPSARPFEFHTFSRLGDRRDSMPKVTLDY